MKLSVLFLALVMVGCGSFYRRPNINMQSGDMSVPTEQLPKWVGQACGGQGWTVLMSYDLPAVKKTRKVRTCMVMDNMDKDCLLWSKPTATETYYTCIDKSLPPGLALVVSEDLMRGWCVGPRLKP